MRPARRRVTAGLADIQIHLTEQRLLLSCRVEPTHQHFGRGGPARMLCGSTTVPSRETPNCAPPVTGIQRCVDAIGTSGPCVAPVATSSGTAKIPARVDVHPVPAQQVPGSRGAADEPSDVARRRTSRSRSWRSRDSPDPPPSRRAPLPPRQDVRVGMKELARSQLDHWRRRSTVRAHTDSATGPGLPVPTTSIPSSVQWPASAKATAWQAHRSWEGGRPAEPLRRPRPEPWRVFHGTRTG